MSITTKPTRAPHTVTSSGARRILQHGQVACIVVTYNPERSRFTALLDAAGVQVGHIYVIDNGSASETHDWLQPLCVQRSEVTWIALGSNKGIAAALNIGIKRALDASHAYVLLLDHDSLPGTAMVEQLLRAAKQLEGEHRIAAIGPRYLDPRQSNPPPFIRIEGFSLVRCQCTNEGEVVPVDYLITSGSLIPAGTLRAVGSMAEELFIDYVDIEWGLRARQHGFQSFGACAAHMEHDLGDAPVHFLGRQIPLHSPLRHYYHMRNAVSLYLRSDFPLNWKLVDGWRLLLKYGFYSLMVPARWQHFSMMTRGIWHGLIGHLGPLKRKPSR